jgi:hypothetical protein
MSQKALTTLKGISAFGIILLGFSLAYFGMASMKDSAEAGIEHVPMEQPEFLTLKNIDGQPTPIASAKKSVLLYNLDSKLGCKVCVNDLTWWKKYRKIYKNVEFVSVYQNEKKDLKPYLEFLKNTGFDGKTLVDDHGTLTNTFHLAGGPVILAFDKESNLVSAVRYNDFGAKKQERGRYFHRLLANLNQ